jgi:hypothetical protein
VTKPGVSTPIARLPHLAALENKLLQANLNASPVDLQKAADKERLAKLDANEAAQLANKPPYFPDVFP